MADKLPPEPYHPEWVPAAGLRTAKPGVYVNAVRILGNRGTEIAETLCETVGADAGPILRQTLGPDVTYFIVEPGPGDVRWPPGVRELAPDEPLRIPAFDAEDAHVEWISRPTPTAPFVSRRALQALLIEATGWTPGEP